MGSNASTGGGGGGVGPAGVKVTKTGEKKYGTAKDAKKVAKRNEFRKFVKSGGVVGTILKGVGEGISKKTKEMNLKRRKKFISKSGLTGDDINMSDEYLSSKEGLAELKKQGYTTVSDNVNTGGGNDGGAIASSGQVVQAPEVTAPTTAEVSQAATTEAIEDDILLRKRRAKAKGRSPTIMTGVTGATGSLTLGKPSLLGS